MHDALLTVFRPFFSLGSAFWGKLMDGNQFKAVVFGAGESILLMMVKMAQQMFLEHANKHLFLSSCFFKLAPLTFCYLYLLIDIYSVDNILSYVSLKLKYVKNREVNE